MHLPPGIKYLLRLSPRIIGPPLLIYLANLFFHTYLHVVLPQWYLVAGYSFCIPLALLFEVQYFNFVNHRAAARLGAVLPPRVGDWTPGGIGSLLAATRAFKTGYPADGAENRFKTIGHTFNLRVFFEDRMFTAEPEYIKAILATQFENFEKGEEVRTLFYPLLGTGVFAADGDMWKYVRFHRSMTRPFFSKDRISHFDNFDRHAEDALRQLNTRLREGYAVDFQDLVARFTMDSATEFLFGHDVCSLSVGLPYPSSPANITTPAQPESHPSNVFIQAFSKAQNITALRTRFGAHWPLAEFWHDRMREPMQIVHEYINPIVAEAVKRKRDAKASGDGPESDSDTLLQNLVNSTEDLIILRDETMSLLVAGRDTTSSTLTFIIYMLAEHPAVLQRLRGEILTKLGNNRRPTFDDFRDMRYLRAVINETLRLYPVVPFNLRTTIKGTIWPSKVPGQKPFYIPPRTRCHIVFCMHRRTDLWGPDALEFDPDRFLDERLHKYLTPNPFIFLPFNAGPRICLGQQFAYHEVSFFLVRLLQTFSQISLAQDAQPPNLAPRPAGLARRDARRARRLCRVPI
ncbi:cytochrome P450 [Infundibulicybe gibba]|nr:cytochrome P450 [Infundibulicybe gibba]